jgi:hypothetical protein
MSGSYVDAAAATISADEAAVAAGIGPALARFENAQTTAAAFVAQHGAAVNNGHADVGYLPPFIPIGE